MSKPLNLHDGSGQIAKSPSDGILEAFGPTVPTGAGYAPGCVFIKTNGNSLGTVSYVNVGTKLVANFVPSAGFLSINYSYGDALAIDAAFFVADRQYVVQSILVRPLVAGTDGGAVTAQIRKAPTGTAPASGTVLHSGTANLKGTIHTNQTLTLVAGLATLTINNGNALVFNPTGVTTAARGLVSVLLLPL